MRFKEYLVESDQTLVTIDASWKTFGDVINDKRTLGLKSTLQELALEEEWSSYMYSRMTTRHLAERVLNGEMTIETIVDKFADTLGAVIMHFSTDANGEYDVMLPESVLWAPIFVHTPNGFYKFTPSTEAKWKFKNLTWSRQVLEGQLRVMYHNIDEYRVARDASHTAKMQFQNDFNLHAWVPFL